MKKNVHPDGSETKLIPTVRFRGKRKNNCCKYNVIGNAHSRRTPRFYDDIKSTSETLAVT